MDQFCAWRRFPRAGVDPISSPEAALAVITTAMQRPLRHETVVLALDAERRGITVVVVDGTADPDAVVVVAECIATAAAGATPAEALVLATVRPGRPTRGSVGVDHVDHDDHDDVDSVGAGDVGNDDLDRWFEASDVVEGCGLELVEWFVICGDESVQRIHCPRDDVGERPRW